MSKIVFVILHYETIDDTKNCIESLMKYTKKNNIEIVVVDNGSKVGKLNDLEDLYKNNKFIKFIRSEINLGFAKGNNIGFEYAKRNLNPEFIILTNSDTVFEQINFIEKLESLYEEYKFDVAGPKIISLADGKNQNPVMRIYNNVGDVKKRIFKFKILYYLGLINLDRFLKSHFSKEIIEVKKEFDGDIQLHGACLIFSKNFINTYSGLYDKTFMYGEESILKYIVERDNMKMMYLDEIEMLHKEGSSTDAIYGKGRAKRLFFYKWNIKGCEILLELMNEGNS